MYDHEEFGIMAKDRKSKQIKLAIMIAVYTLYIFTAIYLEMFLFQEKDIVKKVLDLPKYFTVFTLFIGAIALVKLSQLIFSIYEFILWRNTKINALAHNLMHRLWYKFILTILEIICFIATLLILTQPKFGLKKLFDWEQDTNLTFKH